MKEYNVIQNAWNILKEVVHSKKSARWEIPFSIVTSVLFPVVTTAIPALIISLIMREELSLYLWVVAGLMMVVCLLNIVSNVEASRVWWMVMITRCGSMMNQLFSRVLRTEYRNVEPYERQKEIGKAADAISSNGNGAEGFAHEVTLFAGKLLGIVTYGTAILTLDIRIFLITMLMFALNYLFCRNACRYGDKKREAFSEINRKKNYLWRSALTLEPGKDVRVFQMEKWFHKMGEQLINAQKKLKMLVELRWYFPTVSDQICIFARDLLAYALLLRLVLSGSISPATFTLYLGIISGFSQWINTLALSVATLRRTSHEYNDYRKCLERCTTNVDEGVTVETSKERGPKIEFRHVSFCYEGSTKEVISDVSFVLHPGEKIALVGNNGAGKTTLVKLLCGLYYPTKGTILYNDKDIRKYNRIAYFREISVLFQDFVLLAFTIAMNVAGTEKFNETRVECALKKAGLWDKVSQLPDGINTYITQTINEKGIQLSGGETQKLLLARAIYKDGELLILDEPTSALDPLAESKMYDEYNEFTQSKTSVFISHRLASTKFCERILFMKDGKITEEGTHEQLLHEQKEYANMFEIQSHYYKKGDCENE